MCDIPNNLQGSHICSTDMSDSSDIDMSNTAPDTDLSDRDSDIELPPDYAAKSIDKLVSPCNSSENKNFETPIRDQQLSQITKPMNTYNIEGPIGLERLSTVVKNPETPSDCNECSTAAVPPGIRPELQQPQAASKTEKSSFQFWRRDKWNRLKYCLEGDDPRGLMELLAHSGPTETDYKAIRASAWPSLCLRKRGYRSDYVMDASHGPSQTWRAVMNKSSEIRLHKDTLTVMFKEGLLHKASSHGSLGCLKSLLDHGYDPNVYSVDPRNTTGTPLLAAAVNGHKVAIEMLLKAGSLVNIPYTDGITALHLACLSSDLEITKLLLSVPELRLQTRNLNGQTPLSLVIYNIVHVQQVNRFFDILKLFQEASANVWSVSSKDRYLLHIFVSNSYDDEIIESVLPMLTDMVPDLDIHVDLVGLSPDVSGPKSMFCDPFCSEVLRCKFCDTVDQDVLTKGPTALFLAAQKSDGELLVKLLLQANANLDARSVVANVPKLRAWWYNLKYPEKLYLACLCPTFALTLSKPKTRSFEVASSFEMSMMFRNYKSASLLVQAGQYVSNSQGNAEGFREFPEYMNQDSDDDDDDDNNDPDDDDDDDDDDNNDPFLKLLKVIEASQTLKWWCRRSIRTRLPKGYGRCREAVRSLPVPRETQRYIMLDEELNQ